MPSFRYGVDEAQQLLESSRADLSMRQQQHASLPAERKHANHTLMRVKAHHVALTSAFLTHQGDTTPDEVRAAFRLVAELERQALDAQASQASGGLVPEELVRPVALEAACIGGIEQIYSQLPVRWSSMRTPVKCISPAYARWWVATFDANEAQAVTCVASVRSFRGQRDAVPVIESADGPLLAACLESIMTRNQAAFDSAICAWLESHDDHADPSATAGVTSDNRSSLDRIVSTTATALGVAGVKRGLKWYIESPYVPSEVVESAAAF